MSDVERLFDRCIGGFADDLIALARPIIRAEVERALAKAAKLNRVTQAERQRADRERRQAERLVAKSKLREQKRLARERRRAERLTEKADEKQRRAEEREAQRLSQQQKKDQRLALKHELESERRRLREAERQRRQGPRQLPLDFDGLRAPVRRRTERPVPGAPPPLFVHKRKRDGQIEQLSREKEEAAAAPASAPPQSASSAPA